MGGAAFMTPLSSNIERGLLVVLGWLLASGAIAQPADEPTGVFENPTAVWTRFAETRDGVKGYFRPDPQPRESHPGELWVQERYEYPARGAHGVASTVGVLADIDCNAGSSSVVAITTVTGPETETATGETADVLFSDPAGLSQRLVKQLCPGHSR